MTLRIHGISASRAIRPLWAATELGLTFEHINTSYKGGMTRTPEFLALNPNGHIPVLEDMTDDKPWVISESMACTLYLARAYGKADGLDLSPQNVQEEAQAMHWAFWTVTEIEKDAVTVLMHKIAMPEAERKPELATAAEARLKKPLSILENHLQCLAAANPAYLLGSRFTVADLCVASVVMWIKPATELMSNFPATDAWLQQCMQRPAFKTARKLGG
jgi:glutathione S-transferase